MSKKKSRREKKRRKQQEVVSTRQPSSSTHEPELSERTLRMEPPKDASRDWQEKTLLTTARRPLAQEERDIEESGSAAVKETDTLSRNSASDGAQMTWRDNTVVMREPSLSVQNEAATQEKEQASKTPGAVASQEPATSHGNDAFDEADATAVNAPISPEELEEQTTPANATEGQSQAGDGSQNIQTQLDPHADAGSGVNAPSPRRKKPVSPLSQQPNLIQAAMTNSDGQVEKGGSFYSRPTLELDQIDFPMSGSKFDFDEIDLNAMGWRWNSDQLRQLIQSPKQGVFLIHRRARRRLLASMMGLSRKQPPPETPVVRLKTKDFLSLLREEDPDLVREVEDVEMPSHVLILEQLTNRQLRKTEKERVFWRYWSWQVVGLLMGEWERCEGTAENLRAQIGHRAFEEARHFFARKRYLFDPENDEEVAQQLVAWWVTMGLFAPSQQFDLFPSVAATRLQRWIEALGIDVETLAASCKPDVNLDIPQQLEFPEPEFENRRQSPAWLHYITPEHLDEARVRCRQEARHMLNDSQVEERAPNPRSVSREFMVLIFSSLWWWLKVRVWGRVLSWVPFGQGQGGGFLRFVARRAMLNQIFEFSHSLRWSLRERQRGNEAEAVLQLTEAIGLYKAFAAEKDSLLQGMELEHEQLRHLIRDQFLDTHGIESEQCREILDEALAKVIEVPLTSRLGRQCSSLIKALQRSYLDKHRSFFSTQLLQWTKVFLLQLLRWGFKMLLELVRWMWALGTYEIKFPSMRLASVRHELEDYGIVRALHYVQVTQSKLSDLPIKRATKKRWMVPLHAAHEHLEREVRELFGPLILRSFKEAGLEPRKHRERVALFKIRDEILDLVIHNGKFSFSDVRDIISRNELRLPDPTWWDFLGGDQLLRVDRSLERRFSEIYRESEFYLRALQRVSSISFGTITGRWICRFVLIPFGGAFVIIGGVASLTGPFAKKPSYGQVAAASALGYVGVKARGSVPTLIKALDDKRPDVREAAAQSLGQIGAAALVAVPRLSRSLLDRDSWQVRRAAARALGELGSQIKGALLHKDKNIAIAAVNALGFLGPGLYRALKFNPKNSKEAFVDKSKQWRVQVAMLQAIQRSSEQIILNIPLLWKVLKDKREGMKEAAVAAIRHSAPQIADDLPALQRNLEKPKKAKVLQDKALPLVPLLHTFIDSQHWQVQKATIEALAALKTANSKTTSLLLARLSEKKWEVRNAAVVALGQRTARASRSNRTWNVKVYEKRVMPALFGMLGDSDNDVKESAARALASIGSRAMPLLQSGLKSESLQVREVVVRAIGEVHHHTLPTLKIALQDRYWKVRQLAVRALGKHEEGLVVRLALALQALKDKDSDVRSVAAATLEKLGAVLRKQQALALRTVPIKSRPAPVFANAPAPSGAPAPRRAAVTPQRTSPSKSRKASTVPRDRAPKPAPSIAPMPEAPSLKVGPTSRRALPPTSKVPTLTRRVALKRHAPSTRKPQPRLTRRALLARWSERSVNALRQALAQDRSAAVREAAATALGTFGLVTPLVLETLLRSLLDGQLSVREASARSLGKLCASIDNGRHYLQRALKDDDSHVRAVVLMAFVQLGKVATPLLLNMLKDPDWRVKEAALRSLAVLRTHPKKVVPRLQQMLKENQPQVRVATAQALGAYRIKAATAGSALSLLLKDKFEKVRLAATLALGHVYREVESLHNDWAFRLGEATYDSSPKVRLAALKVMGQLGIKALSGIADMVYALRSQDSKVRRVAVEAMGRLGPPLAQALNSGDPKLRERAQNALAHLRGNLLKALYDKNTHVREAAANALTLQGEQAAEVLPLLLKALWNKDADIRHSAAMALGRLNPNRVHALLPSLEEHLQGKNHRTQLSLTPILLLGLLLLLIIHTETGYNIYRQVLRGIADGFRFLYYEAPHWLRQRQWVQDIITHPLAFPLYRHLVLPLFVSAVMLTGIYLTFELSTINAIAVFAISMLLVYAFLNTPVGRAIWDQIAYRLLALGQQIKDRFVIGLVYLILDFFRNVLFALDYVIYRVDDLLRFHQGESRIAMVFKAIGQVVWYTVTYLIRVVVNLCAEPQLNPIKHFPVVTVSHKMIIPYSAAAMFWMSQNEFSKLSITIVTLFFQFGLPGFFGFLVWEFKENWKLFRANEAKTPPPVRVGSHGETMDAFLRRGFHSGTLPKIYDKLFAFAESEFMHNEQDKRFKLREQIHHVEESLQDFVERDLLGALRQRTLLTEKFDTFEAKIEKVGENHIDFLLWLGVQESGDHFRWRLRIELEGGWLLGEIVVLDTPDLEDEFALTEEERATINDDLSIFLQKCGVKIMRSKLEEQLSFYQRGFDVGVPGSLDSPNRAEYWVRGDQIFVRRIKHGKPIKPVRYTLAPEGRLYEPAPMIGLKRGDQILPASGQG